MKNCYNQNYSFLIKAIRKKLNITQKNMATLLGVSFATLNRWENGHFNPTFKYKTRINRIFNELDIKSLYTSLNGGEKR